MFGVVAAVIVAAVAVFHLTGSGIGHFAHRDMGGHVVTGEHDHHSP
jgi:hypothetical protein